MTKADKQSVMDRIQGAGKVTPALAEGQTMQEPVRDIETITGELLEAKRRGGEAILTIGHRLIEAKSVLSDGEWLSWLADKADFSPRTAQRFMRLAREWSDATALSHLGASKALQLLALPESEREEFMGETHQVDGEVKTVIDMTSRELEKAIKERDEARKAEEQAKADAHAAEEARASTEKLLKTANEMLELSKTEKEMAETSIADLEKQLAELKSAPVSVAVMSVDQEKLDQARAEGEASKAEELAELQKNLDKAKETKKAADEKRKQAEADVAELKKQLEEAVKAKVQSDLMADPDMAKFEVYFNQAQEVVNKLRGILLKARGRDDQTAAEKIKNAILALSDAVKGAAQ